MPEKAKTAKKPTTSKASKADTAKKPAKPKATKAAKKSESAVKGPLDVAPYKEKRGEKYMGAKMQAHFREILTLWKDDLMSEVDRTLHHMQDDAAVYPDPIDRASQEEEFSLELRTRDRERKLIRKIEEALLRLDHEEYGLCNECGADIGLRRLEARPTAMMCIDCKTFDEIRERQWGD